MCSLIQLHLQLLIVEVASLSLLHINKFFFLIVPFFDLLVVSRFFLSHQVYSLGMWTTDLVRIFVLHFSLEVLDLTLASHLNTVVCANSLKTLIIVRHFINSFFAVFDGLFQLNRLFQLCIHHVLLPLFALPLSFQVLFIVCDILFHDVLVYILHLFVDH